MPFLPIPSGKSPFLKIVQDVVDMLERTTAAEKGQAVPYLLMWEIDPRTGEPVNKLNEKDPDPASPLSLRMSEPPRFGASVEADAARYRERPPVSLERVVVKTVNPNGIINYREVEIAFMVHRPDVIFGEPVKGIDNWSTVLVPGSVIAMEYGWRASSGVKNGFLNGEGFSDLQSKPPVIVPGKKRVRFTVVNYTFAIQPDGQIAVTVKGIEDGEFNLRKAVPGLATVVNKALPESNRIDIGSISDDPQSTAGKKAIASLQKMIITDLKPDNKGLIKFSSLCDVLFSRVISEAYTSLGYHAPDMYLGNFNERCGATAKKYGAVNLSGLNIGEFLIPLSEIEKTLGSLLKLGEELTFTNFVQRFLSLIRDARVWDTSAAKKDKDAKTKLQTIPELVIRPVINKKDVVVYIFDAKTEFTKFSPTDKFDTKVLGAVTRDDIRKKLRDKGVPMISFFKGNSYIAGANFEVIADDQIKTIFIRRYLKPTREELQGPSNAPKKNTMVDPRQLLYSQAIRGELTMLGNSAFDLFSLVWLDFGVPRWDGPFTIFEQEDNITPSEFNTKITLVSAGGDPLGTQGRADFDAEKQAIKDENAAKAQAKKPKKKAVRPSQK